MRSDPVGVRRVGRGVVPPGVGGLHLGHLGHGFRGVCVLWSPPDKGSAQLPPAHVKLSPHPSLKRPLCVRGVVGWELEKNKVKSIQANSVQFLGVALLSRVVWYLW